MDDDSKAWHLTAKSIESTNRQTTAMFCVLVMLIVFQTCFLGWLEYDSRWRYGQEIKRVVMSQSVSVQNGEHENLTSKILKDMQNDVRGTVSGHSTAGREDSGR